MLDRTKKPLKPRKRMPASTVGLFYDVCRYPPLLPTPNGLTDFQFVVLAACLSSAWDEHKRITHAYAYNSSGKALAARRKAMDADADFNAVGKTAYDKAFDYKILNLPDSVEFEITASKLLKNAGLARKGTNFTKLTAALNRLQGSIFVNGKKWKPVLLAWRKMKNGKLRLTVNGVWFPDKGYAAVQLPLPMNVSGARILPLYLLIHTFDYKHRGKIGFAKLCRALGIAFVRQDNAKRALAAAVEGVNLALRRHVVLHDNLILSNTGVRLTVRSVLERSDLAGACRQKCVVSI